MPVSLIQVIKLIMLNKIPELVSRFFRSLEVSVKMLTVKMVIHDLVFLVISRIPLEIKTLNFVVPLYVQSSLKSADSL